MDFSKAQDFEWKELGDGTVEITGYVGNDIQVNIPAELGGKSVKKIGPSAFQFCKALESVKIPAGVAEIDDSAFMCCDSLKYINIPDGVVRIGGAAFFGCPFTEVTIPASVEDIDDKAFACCHDLEKITVSDDNGNFSSVGAVMFNKDKTRIVFYSETNREKEYLIPDSVKEIAKNAFLGASALEALTVSDSSETFSSVDGVLFSKDGTRLILYPEGRPGTEYTIPDSVTGIEYGIFEGLQFGKLTLTYKGTQYKQNNGSFGEQLYTAINGKPRPSRFGALYDAIDAHKKLMSEAESLLNK
ncbi:MAG: leucine-rich repeat domain-containing protein [Ruminiclostridium sp.]|nr:leucine-rich repeat domain-containing protein [Ruminiclostridium sp.]